MTRTKTKDTDKTDKRLKGYLCTLHLLKMHVEIEKGRLKINCLLEKFYTHTNMHMYTHTQTIKKVKELYILNVC